MNTKKSISQEAPVKVLRASAGSGKTYRLTYEYVRRVVMNPEAYSHILAVTFTNRATEEMKDRILKALSQLSLPSSSLETKYMRSLTVDTGLTHEQVRTKAKAALGLILHDYSGFAVSTIDSFFQRIARGFFRELGLNFGYEVELEGGGYLERAVARLLERSATDRELRQLIENVVSEQLEKNKWDVRKDLRDLGNMMLNESGSFIENLDHARISATWRDIRAKVEAARPAVVTACKKALEALTQAGIDPEEVSYKAAGLLQNIVAGKKIAPVGSRLRNIAVYPAENLVPRKSPQRATAAAHAQTLQLNFKLAVDAIDTQMIMEGDYAVVAKNFSKFMLLSELGRELDKLWGEDNRLPIHRTTSLIARIVEQAAVPFIYEKIGTRYETYMIDEFQDTSLSQWSGFLPLLGEAASVSHDGSSVMLIGDVKQAIYRWRGGDWNTLASGVGAEFGSSADQSEQLTSNFRSCERIVAFNNALTEKVVALEKESIEAIIGDNSAQVAKYHGALDVAYADFRQDAAGKNAKGGYVCIDLTSDRIGATISHIHELIAAGYTPGRIAVLVRRREEGAVIASALLGAGFNVLSNESLYINSSQTVRFAAACLGLSIDSGNLIARGIFNIYRGAGVTDEMPAEELRFLTRIRLYTPVEAIEALITHYDLSARDVAYVQAFYQAAVNFSTTKSAELGAFYQWWSGTASQSQALSLPENTDGITILTIHKSKGLQFDAVVIPWATWNFDPKTNSTFVAEASAAPFSDLGPVIVNYVNALGEGAFREAYIRETAFSNIDNINLLYVAVTRAKQALIMITDPADKTKGNTTSALVNRACELMGPMLEVTTLPDGTLRYTLGALTTPYNDDEESTQVSELTINEMITRERIERIATRGLQWVVSEDTDQMEKPMSARDYGITMHEVLSSIGSLDEIPEAMERQVAAGRIGKAQGEDFAADLTEAARDERVCEWFDERWEVISEREILFAKGGDKAQHELCRPDRVMTDGERTVVVDYKFGLCKAEHGAQVRRYVSLLEAMGYPSVEGYLWYVADRLIEKV